MCFVKSRKKYTEAQTRNFYNRDDAVYRSFWDTQGNCHWGYFPKSTTTFLQAMTELNKKMLKLAKIYTKSKVLDLGCGNGNNSFFLYKKTGAKVTGIDLSDARIKNARSFLADSDAKTKKRVSFVRASATRLPFPDRSFSHVWSQSTLYHVHDKKKALREVRRVLKDHGIFILDDLIRPNAKISKDAEKLIFDRLLFRTDYTFDSYQEELRGLGFTILFAEDLSKHYALSYRKLADIAEEKIREEKDVQFHSKYKKLITAYRKSAELADRGDIGWALFVCRKT